MDVARFYLASTSILGILICGLTGCDDCSGTVPPKSSSLVTIDQGIWGDVWFWEGDFFPPCPSGSVRGVSRQLIIHELTSIEDVEVDDSGFITSIHTNRVASTASNARGFFEIALPVGAYSVFVREDSLHYLGLRVDQEGHLYPARVDTNATTESHFDIQYHATF